MNIVTIYNCKHDKIKSIPIEIDNVKHRELICIDCHKSIEVITQKEYDNLFEPKI
jgi:hypothetical protein